jgi:PleD family two-component response regulator
MEQAYIKDESSTNKERVKGKTILIVDDETEVLVLLQRILKEYETVTAEGGPMALEEVKKQNIDLILLDIAMPEMSGFEVAKRLKDDPATSHIPIIFVSARRDLDSFVEGFEIGIEDYITKPIDQNYLLFTIDSKLS